MLDARRPPSRVQEKKKKVERTTVSKTLTHGIHFFHENPLINQLIAKIAKKKFNTFHKWLPAPWQPIGFEIEFFSYPRRTGMTSLGIDRSTELLRTRREREREKKTERINVTTTAIHQLFCTKIILSILNCNQLQVTCIEINLSLKCYF